MKKHLLGVAVAAALTSPAMAQQVTIGGFINGSYDYFGISAAASTRVGGVREDRVADNSSRVLFNAREDLGGGMSAIAQFDLRFSVDAPGPVGDLTGAATGINPVSAGNNHVGLGGAWGTVRLGRQDIQYIENATFTPVGQATIANHAGLFHSAAVGQTMTRATRTNNLIWYTSPRINGVQGTLGYSTNPIQVSGNPTGMENDLGKSGTNSGSRKGSGTYLKLDASLGQLNLVYSQVDLRSDYTGLAQGVGAESGSTAYTSQAVPNHLGQVVTAKYDLGGGLRLGVGYSKNQSQTINGGAVAQKTVRQGFQVGVGYTTGANEFSFAYTDMGDVKLDGTSQVNTGSKQYGVSYGYNLSKRTQLHASWTMLDNETARNDGLFYNGATVLSNVTALNGERHSAYSVGLRHSF